MTMTIIYKMSYGDSCPTCYIPNAPQISNSQLGIGGGIAQTKATSQKDSSYGGGKCTCEDNDDNSNMILGIGGITIGLAALWFSSKK